MAEIDPVVAELRGWSTEALELLLAKVRALPDAEPEAAPLPPLAIPRGVGSLVRRPERDAAGRVTRIREERRDAEGRVVARSVRVICRDSYTGLITETIELPLDEPAPARLPEEA